MLMGVFFTYLLIIMQTHKTCMAISNIYFNPKTLIVFDDGYINWRSQESQKRYIFTKIAFSEIQKLIVLITWILCCSCVLQTVFVGVQCGPSLWRRRASQCRTVTRSQQTTDPTTSTTAASGSLTCPSLSPGSWTHQARSAASRLGSSVCQLGSSVCQLGSSVCPLGSSVCQLGSSVCPLRSTSAQPLSSTSARTLHLCPSLWMCRCPWQQLRSRKALTRISGSWVTAWTCQLLAMPGRLYSKFAWILIEFFWQFWKCEGGLHNF